MPISLLGGVGVGMSIAAWFSAVVSDVSPNRFGIANATLRTIQQVFYGVGVAMVITLTASHPGLAGYRLGWLWVTVTMFASAAIFVGLFPAGSSSRRAGVASPVEPTGR